MSVESSIRSTLECYGYASIEDLTFECIADGVCSSRATVKKYLDQMSDVEALPGRPVRYRLKRTDASKFATIEDAIFDFVKDYSSLDFSEVSERFGIEAIILKNALKADDRFFVDGDKLCAKEPSLQDQQPEDSPADPAPTNPTPEPKAVFEPAQSDCLDNILDTIRRMADENMMLKRQLKAVREALA